MFIHSLIPVYPRLVIHETVKSFMIVKAGNTIRVRIPFEVSMSLVRVVSIKKNYSMLSCIGISIALETDLRMSRTGLGQSLTLVCAMLQSP